MKLRRQLLITGFVGAGLLNGCSTAPKKTPEDQRQAILTMRNDTLAELYEFKDSAKEEVEAAPAMLYSTALASKYLLLAPVEAGVLSSTTAMVRTHS